MKLGTVATVMMVGSSAAFTTPVSKPVSTSLAASSKADLEALGKELNPILGYFDPLKLADTDMWGQSEEFTIKFLRQSEIKHGRVAMAAFVGYCVQSNFHWPWAMTTDGDAFPSTDLTPPEQWDALPTAAKAQIILFVGFLEFYSELYPGEGTVSALPHYTKPDGIPGKFPTFDDVPHPVPFNLFDPFKFSKNRSEADKARGLVVETNNGRLAMLGIFGFLCAQKIPGSVPVLSGIVGPYDGEPMAPFASDFHIL
uniref:Uncharacterized protein n=1 Tax=Cyclophora tenuis TaxID=216820 RepID=A0A7S1D2A2_CYCTE